MTTTENVGNATEALEQALGMDEPLAPDVLTALAALGWKVVPIDESPLNAYLDYIQDAHDKGHEQAAEAADAAAEAAYQNSQNTDPQYREQRAYERGVVDEARRHPDQHPSAAAVPEKGGIPCYFRDQGCPSDADDDSGHVHPAAVAPLDRHAVRVALDRAWVASRDAQGQPRPPDLASHLWAYIRPHLPAAAYADAIRKRGGA